MSVMWSGPQIRLSTQPVSLSPTDWNPPGKADTYLDTLGRILSDPCTGM